VATRQTVVPGSRVRLRTHPGLLLTITYLRVGCQIGYYLVVGFPLGDYTENTINTFIASKHN
jgi:hypothetical protein